MLAAAIRDAELEPCQLSERPAPSMVARVQCPRICLDLASVGPAMLYEGSMPPDRYTLSFVLDCAGGGNSFNFGTRFAAGYLGFFPPGALLDATNPAGCVNAMLTVSVEVLHEALATHFPEVPGRVLERGAGMRVGAAESARLGELLSPLGQGIHLRGGVLPGVRTCRELERILLPAFIAALRSGCGAIIPAPKPRAGGRHRRLRKARDFIAGHLHEPIHVGDLCAASGLSERGLDNLFHDLVGIGPAAFLRRQRLHCARRDLLRAEREPGRVKRAALEAGCFHLGRFASEYRDLFGERPSETLQRRS